MRCVCMRVCKHGCNVKMFCCARVNHASVNLKKVLSWKLDKCTLFTPILCLLKLGKQHPTSLQDKYPSLWKDLSWLPDGPIMPAQDFLLWQSFVDQAYLVMIGGYWPFCCCLFLFCIFVDLNFISVHKKATKNLTKSQPSWPSLHALYSTHVILW